MKLGGEKIRGKNQLKYNENINRSVVVSSLKGFNPGILLTPYEYQTLFESMVELLGMAFGFQQDIDKMNSAEKKLGLGYY